MDELMNSLKKFFKNLFVSPKSKRTKIKTDLSQSHVSNVSFDFDENDENLMDRENAHFHAVMLSMQENFIIKKLSRSSIKLNIILSGLLFISLIYSAVATWFAIHPVREYFAADNGRIIRMIPLSEPHQNNQSVIQFVRDTLNNSFSLDFLNYKRQLEDVRVSYTDSGFSTFLEELKKSGILNAITNKRMNLYISTGTGVIKQKGVSNGRYYWIIQIPVDIRLIGQNTELPAQRFIATVKVQRIDVLDSINGIAVAQLITKPNK